jgi:hypothetical protein
MTSKKARRRPGRDPQEDTTTQHTSSATTDVETETQAEAKNEETTQGTSSSSSENHDRKKIHIQFYGSEKLKEKAPVAFELAETVAEEWVNDGRFEGLPVGHPLAQAVAAYGLRKAKKIEKDLEAKGVFALIKVGIDYAQSKIRR